MPTQNLGSLSVTFAGDISKFLRQLQSLTNQFEKIDQLAPKIQQAFAPLSGLSNLGNLATQVGQLARSLSQLATASNRVATAQTKMNTAIQGTGPAVQQAGQQVAGVAANMQALGQQAGQAAAGLGKMGGAFQGLLRIPTGGGLFNKLFGNFTQGVTQALSVLTRFSAASAIFSGVTEGIQATITAFVTFDDQMAQLGAITRATETDMKAFADAAREIGRSTIISAPEAIRALTLLGQAGFTATESIQGLKAAVALSVGGVASLEASTSILTSTIRAFNLNAAESNRVANVLTAVVNQSKSSIEDLNIAFNFAGSAAAAAGLEIEDLGAIVGVLADRGIRASTQGTAVRQVVSALIEPTERAAKVFERLGLNLSSIDPRANDIVDVLNRLKAAGFGADEAFQAFDLRIASTVALLVRNSDAIGRMREDITLTNDAFDAFNIRQNSVSAQATILGNKLKDVGIGLGEAIRPALLGVIGLFNQLSDVADGLEEEIIGLAVALVVFRTRLVQAAAPLITVGGGIAGVTLGAHALALAIGAAAAAILISSKATQEYIDGLNASREAAAKSGINNSRLADSYEAARAGVDEAKAGTVEYAVASAELDRVLFQLLTRFPELASRLDETGKRFTDNASVFRQSLREGPIIQEIERLNAEITREIASGPDLKALFLSALEGIPQETDKLIALRGALVDANKALETLRGQNEGIRAGFKAILPEIDAFGEAVIRGTNEEKQGRLRDLNERLLDMAKSVFDLDQSKAAMSRFGDVVASATAGNIPTLKEFIEILEKAGATHPDEQAAQAFLDFFARIASKSNLAREQLEGFNKAVDDLRQKAAKDLAEAEADIAGRQAQLAALQQQKSPEEARIVGIEAKAKHLEDVVFNSANRIRDSYINAFGDSAEQSSLALQVEGAAVEQNEALKRGAYAKTLQVKIQALEAGQKKEASATAEITRLEAKNSAERLRRAGEFVAAVEIEAKAEREAILEETRPGKLQNLKLEAAEIKRLTDLETARNKESEQGLRTDLTLLPKKLELLEQEKEHVLALLDLELKLAEAGKLPGGKAQNVERIERERNAAQRSFIQKEIAARNAARDTIKAEVAQGRLNDKQQASLLTLEQETRELEFKNDLLIQEVELIHKAGDATIDFAGIASTTLHDAFEGVILQTADLNEILESAGLSLARSIGDAFQQSLIEKAGFDKVFETNFLELGETAFSSISGGLSDAFGAAIDGVSQFASSATASMNQVADAVSQTTDEVAGMTSAFEEAEVGVPTSSSGMAPNAGAPGVTPGLGATGGASTGASIVAIVGAIIAIAQAAKSIADSQKRIDKASRGTAGSSFAAGSGIGTGIGVGAGAGLGAAIGSIVPGIGTVIGAALGAAIGAIVSKIVSESIADALVSGINESVAKGGSQEDLNRKVFQKTRLLRGLVGGQPLQAITGKETLSGDKLADNLITGLLSGGIMSLLFTIFELAAKSPNIETIFDKIFAEVAETAGVTLKTHLSDAIGQGLSKAERQVVKAATARPSAGAPRGGPSRDISLASTQVITGLIGAGVFNEDRLGRFRNFLVNTLGEGKHSVEELGVAFELFYQRVLGTGLDSAVTRLRASLGVTKNQFDNFVEGIVKGSRQMKNFSRNFDEGVKSIKRGLAGISLEDTRKLLLLTGEAPSGQKAKKASRQTVEGAGSALFTPGEAFEGPKFDANFGAFVIKLRDGVRDAMTEGIVQSLFKGLQINLLLANFFTQINKIARRASKVGLTDEIKTDILDTIEKAGSNLAKRLELLKPFFKELQKIINEADEKVKDLIETEESRKEAAKQEASNRQGLIDQIIGAFRNAITNLIQEMRVAGANMARLTQKIFTTGGGEGIAPEAITFLRDSFEDVRKFIEPLMADTGFGVEGKRNALQTLEQAVDDFLSTATQQIVEMFGPAIEQARAFRDAAKSAAETLLGFRTRKGATATTEDRMELVRQEIEKQRSIMESGKPEEQLEAGERMKTLLQQLLAIGEEDLDTTGPAFRSLESEVEKGLEEVETAFTAMGANLEDLQTQMDEKLKAIREEAKAQYEWIKTHTAEVDAAAILEAQSQLEQTKQIISALTGKNVGSVSDAIAALMGTDTKTLADIAAAIGLIRTDETKDTGDGGGDGGDGPPPPKPPGETIEGKPTEVQRDRAKRFFRLNELFDSGLDIEKVRNAVTNAIEELRSSLIGTVPDDMVALIPTILNGIKSGLFGSLDLFSGPLAWQDLADLANQMHDVVQNYKVKGFEPHMLVDRFYKHLSAQFSPPPGHYEGAIAMKQHFANIAERGPEAIIPLDTRGLNFFMTALNRVAERSQVASNTNSIMLQIAPGAITIKPPPGTPIDMMADELIGEVAKSIKSGRLRRVTQDLLKGVHR